MRYLTIFMLAWGALSVQAQDAEVLATAYQTVNVRSGPGTQFDIVGQLQAGDTAAVLGRDSAATRWLNVLLPDSEVSGWVATFTVTLDADPANLPVAEPEATSAAPETIQITSYGRVNVRNGPGIHHDIIGQLDVESSAQVTARSNYNNDWLYIENADIAGWVAYFTVTVSGQLVDLPVLVPDPVTGELVEPVTLIRASYNVRLHTLPRFTAPVVDTLPFETQVTPVGITPDGRWLYIISEDLAGWAWVRLFDISDEQLSLIPQRRP
jgi:uncharacterized protein YraI